MIDIEQLERELASDQPAKAISSADKMLAHRGGASPETVGMALYLRGNAHRRQGNIRLALNDYLASIELFPDGPAADAYRMAQEVLNFYHHDLYNP